LDNAKNLNIEKWQINLMLSELYEVWFINNKEDGKFPEFKNVSDDWEQIRIVDVNQEIRVKNNKSNLPVVKFKFLEATSQGILAITNSNSFFRARLLQWIGKDIKEGKEEFKGEIDILKNPNV
jgi:hypothetical protein